MRTFGTESGPISSNASTPAPGRSSSTWRRLCIRFRQALRDSRSPATTEAVLDDGLYGAGNSRTFTSRTAALEATRRSTRDVLIGHVSRGTAVTEHEQTLCSKCPSLLRCTRLCASVPVSPLNCPGHGSTAGRADSREVIQLDVAASFIGRGSCTRSAERCRGVDSHGFTPAWRRRACCRCCGRAIVARNPRRFAVSVVPN